MKKLTKEQQLKVELNNLLRENKIFPSLFTDKAYEQLFASYKKYGPSAVKNFMKEYSITPKSQVILVATNEIGDLEVHTTESFVSQVSKTKKIIEGTFLDFADDPKDVAQPIK